MDGFDYKYEDMEVMDTKTLSEIVENIWSLGFEETVTALQILKQRIPSKALEYGIDILVNDKGDDYLQAIVWDYFFLENKEIILDAVYKRKSSIGKVLLNDMMHYIAKFEVNIPDKMVNRILETFDSFSEEEKANLLHDPNEFLRIYRKG